MSRKAQLSFKIQKVELKLASLTWIYEKKPIITITSYRVKALHPAC
jgi:hypothetical protein